MKITYINKKPDQVNFGDILVGQTFFDRLGNLCMKVNKQSGEWNFVSLSSHYIYEYTSDTMVTPVSVELIVNGEKP